jgi:hypothetical protein
VRGPQTNNVSPLPHSVASSLHMGGQQSSENFADTDSLREHRSSRSKTGISLDAALQKRLNRERYLL